MNRAGRLPRRHRQLPAPPAPTPPPAPAAARRSTLSGSLAERRVSECRPAAAARRRRRPRPKFWAKSEHTFSLQQHSCTHLLARVRPQSIHCLNLRTSRSHFLRQLCASVTSVCLFARSTAAARLFVQYLFARYKRPALRARPTLARRWVYTHLRAWQRRHRQHPLRRRRLRPPRFHQRARAKLTCWRCRRRRARAAAA